MEGKRQQGGPSSSIAADIFGAKESSASQASAGAFASIFPPPQTVVGRKLSSELAGSRMKQSTGNQAWNSRQANSPSGANANMLPEERGEPCHLSSSLYYGGRDVYSHSPSIHNQGTYPTIEQFKKDGEKDDPNSPNSHGVSRGNWWEGSLYY
ncbi:hypothetical protein SAY86_008779 [Trapa natans]|uniref:Uncharacterized protein n=1 Tax=Trapa natans TaxID=22666 RepID=A0AAN7KFE0_TRANT|nr:hypothetical protein SAY86_008779 [Trapa natans]